MSGALVESRARAERGSEETCGTWHAVGPISAIPVRGARVVETDEGAIALFRLNDAEVRAVRDACPHKGGPLSEGIVSGDRVSCPLHAMCFSLTTGEAVAPDALSVKTYHTRVRDGLVELRLHSTEDV